MRYVSYKITRLGTCLLSCIAIIADSPYTKVRFKWLLGSWPLMNSAKTADLYIIYKGEAHVYSHE
jgi:hypothetical protein